MNFPCRGSRDENSIHESICNFRYSAVLLFLGETFSACGQQEGKDHVSSRGIPGALGQTGKGRGDGNDKRVQVAESAGLQVCRSAGGLHNQGKDDQGPRMSQSQADIDV